MTAKTHVFFVEGGGVTTALPQIQALLEQSSARVTVFYDNDTAGKVESLEPLQALKDRYLPRLSLCFLFGGDPQDIELFNGRLDDGKVRELARTLFDPVGVDEFWLAAPQGAVSTVSATLQALGVPAVRIRGTDNGAVPRPAENIEAADVAQLSAHATQVTVIMDGRRRSFTMARDSGASLLDAAEQAGFDLPFSCRAGVCSTCRTKVVKGSVEMLENYALEDWEIEQGYVLACQSRPKTAELELDYDDK